MNSKARVQISVGINIPGKKEGSTKSCIVYDAKVAKSVYCM